MVLKILLLNLMFLSLFNLVLADEKMLSWEDLNSLQSLNEMNKVDRFSKTRDKIFYFWATWCPDCKEKLMTIFRDQKIYEKYDVFLISTDKDKEKIEHYQKKFEIRPFVVLDNKKIIQKKLSIFSVPSVVQLHPEASGLKVVKTQNGGKFEFLIKE